jgi:hypothetical protein
MLVRMSEAESTKPAPPKRPRNRRVVRKNLFQRIASRLPLPGWALTGLGLGQEIFSNFRWLKRAFEYGEHTQFAADILSAAGVTTPAILLFVASPIFGIGLITLGLGYSFLVPEAKRSAVKSPYPAVAWMVIAISAALMVSALIVKTTLEQPAIVELAKNHPGKARHLSDEQIEKLKYSFQKHPSLVNTQFYISSSTDDESQVYAGAIYDALKDAGAHIMGAPLGTCGDSVGVVVTIFDPDHPSAEATDMMALLEDAKLNYHKERWEKRHRDGWPTSPDFMLYVCPSIDRRPS